MPAAIELPQIQDAEAKQALRLRRFYMAAATYVMCAGFAQTCTWLGYLPPWLPGWWTSGIVIANVGFYLAFRNGWNLRLHDPSMTEPQLLVSTLSVLVFVYFGGAARGAFLTLLVVPLLFGVLRLRLYQMARIGAFGIAGYAILISALELRQPETVQIELEMLHLLALTLTMIFVCLLGGYISKVRSELSRSVAMIRDMAQRDPLTGVFNRRHLIDTLEREVARCERNAGCGIALCMVDLDFFKRINDTFGHPVGDEVLVAVAKRVTESIRGSDYLARYGGEEFVMVLDGGSAEVALAVCERIRHQTTRLDLPALGGMPLSVSIGVAVHEAGDSSESLLERADKALYQAKADGRNCIRMMSLNGIGAAMIDSRPDTAAREPRFA